MAVPDMRCGLRGRLGGTSHPAALTKLRFIVKRHVDLDKWLLEGERLLDLRKGFGVSRARNPERKSVAAPSACLARRDSRASRCGNG